MLTGLLGLVKALGAPLPLWVVVLPAVLDLALAAVLVFFLFVAFLFFWQGDYEGKIKRR